MDIKMLVAQLEAAKEKAVANLPRLNFACSPPERTALKQQISAALAGVPQRVAEDILRDREILPAPSRFQVMSSGRGYAVVFVVGPAYETLPVVIEAT